MLRYLIIGSGYRSEYFGRVSKIWPAFFQALFLCRSEEKKALILQHTGVEATISLNEALAFMPDFVVVAVDRSHLADVAIEWVLRGFPVVTETPVADTPEKMQQLWDLFKQGAKIVCCEQYHRFPILSAGLEAVSAGLIGPPSSLYLSLLHDYHGASLIRLALGIMPGEEYSIRGLQHRNLVTETDSRYGAILDGRTKEMDRDIAMISFASGKTAVYDFCSVQYRSYIRSRHLTLRGACGEWSDNLILYLDDQYQPRRKYLLPELPDSYRVLDTQALRDRRRNWQFELAPDTVQDEFAIASILLDMEKYISGGPSPYPLVDALEDALFWLRLNEAVRSGNEIQVQKRPWG